MITIHKNASLKSYNTFGIDCRCRALIEYTDEKDLKLLYDKGIFQDKWMALGYGANTLFDCGFYDGYILHHTLRLYKVENLAADDFRIYANAGWIWDDLIEYTMHWGISGAENLSGIPASLGGAIVQNIGAYGMEISDLVARVSVFDTITGNTAWMSNAECGFAYRTSVFKHDNCTLIVTGASLNLCPEISNWKPCLKYAPLREFFRPGMNANNIREWVLTTRNSKLPDPKILGNAGSFFVNPVVSPEKAEELASIYPDIPRYKAEGGIKLAAGWLIDHAGLKGYRNGPVGIDSRNALVIVNYGKATGRDVLSLSSLVISEVKRIFGVELKPEVRVIGV